MKLFADNLSSRNFEISDPPQRILQPSPKFYSESEIELVERLENLIGQVRNQKLSSCEIQNLLDATNQNDYVDSKSYTKSVQEDTQDIMDQEEAEAAAWFVTGWWVHKNFQKVKSEDDGGFNV